MILDDALYLEEEQDAYADGVVDYVGDGIDTLSADANPGAGLSLFIKCVVTTQFAGGTSAQFVLYESADDSTYTEALYGDVFLVAATTAGTVLYEGAIPVDTKRYLKPGILNVGTNTAGAVSVYMYIG